MSTRRPQQTPGQDSRDRPPSRDPLIARTEAFFQRYQAAVDRRMALLLAPSTHRADVLRAVAELLDLASPRADAHTEADDLAAWMDAFNENADVFVTVSPFLEDAIELAQRFPFDIVLVQADFPAPHRRHPDQPSALQGLLLPLVAKVGRSDPTLVRVIGTPQSFASSFDARLVCTSLEGAAVTDVASDPHETWQRVLTECIEQRAGDIIERQVGLVEAEALAGQLQSAARQAHDLAQHARPDGTPPAVSAVAGLVSTIEAAELGMLGGHWTLSTLFPIEAKRLHGSEGIVPRLGQVGRQAPDRDWPAVHGVLTRLHQTCTDVARRLRSVNRDRYVAKLFLWEPFVKLSHPGGEFGELRVPNYLVNVESLRRQVKAYGDLLEQCRTRLGVWRPFLPTGCFGKVQQFTEACGARLASLRQAAAGADLPTCRQAVTSLSTLSDQLKQAHRFDLLAQFAVGLGVERVVTRPPVAQHGSTALFEVYCVADEVAQGLQHLFDPQAFPIEAVELTKQANAIELKVVQTGTLEPLRETFDRASVRAGAGLRVALEQLAGHCELVVSAFARQHESRYYPFRDEFQRHPCTGCEPQTVFTLSFPQPDPRDDRV